MRQVVPMHYDTIFKKVFGDKEVFVGFVKAVLGIDIEVTQIDFEKSFSETIGTIRPRFDLFAEDTKNRIIVEIQREHYTDHYDRFLYYQCLGVIQQANTATGYRSARTMYTIVVHTSAGGIPRDRLTSDWSLRTDYGEVIGNIHHKLVFLNSHYVNEDTDPSIRVWLDLMEDSLDAQVDETRHIGSLLSRAVSLAETDSLTPDDRAKLIDDQNETTALEEREALGEMRGRAEGEMKLLKAALNIAAKGMPLDQVAELVGISLADLQVAVETGGLRPAKIP